MFQAMFVCDAGLYSLFNPTFLRGLEARSVADAIDALFGDQRSRLKVQQLHARYDFDATLRNFHHEEKIKN